MSLLGTREFVHLVLASTYFSDFGARRSAVTMDVVSGIDRATDLPLFINTPISQSVCERSWQTHTYELRNSFARTARLQDDTLFCPRYFNSHAPHMMYIRYII